MIKKSTVNLTAKGYSKLIAQGSVKFDNEVQRGYVWDKQRKTLLINSLLMGYPVPPLYATRNSGVYDVLDGQQRSRTISSYINNEFALSDCVVKDEQENEVDLTGKYFNQLSEEMQDTIKDTSILMYCFDEITEEETAELFRRLNNGKPLSTKELNVAYCKDIKTCNRIAQHSIFARVLSPKAMENKNHIAVVMKLYTMVTQDYLTIDFSSKVFNPILRDTIIESDKEALLYTVLNYYNSVLEEVEKADKKAYKKATSEVNFVSFIPFMKLFMETTRPVNDMKDFVIDFWNSDNAEYKEACTNGTAKNINIVLRHEAIENALEIFFKG